MSAPIKGFPSNNKTSVQRDLKYANVEPVSLQKSALVVKNYEFCQSIGVDAVEAGSTTSTIVATAHAVMVGDVIYFTSGAFQNLEVMVQTTSTNSFVISEELSAAPGVGDTFEILRHKTPVVDAAGSIATSSGPITFIRDAATQVVTEDTVTPANNRPLPVKLTGIDGDVLINAGNVNLEVQLDHNSAVPDSVRIGDGTETVSITAANQMEVAVTAALPAGNNNIGDVDIASIVPGTGATNLGKAEDSLHTDGDVGVMSLAVRNDAGTPLAADGDYIPITTNSTGSIYTSLTTAIPAGNNNIGDVDVVTEPATSADGAAAPAVGKMMGAFDGANLQFVSCDANGELQIDIVGALPAGNNNIGDVDVASVIPGVAATNLGKAEDAVHGSGDTGVMALAVRNDAGTAFAADGDYVPLSINAASELRTSASVSSIVPGTGATNLGKAEDAAHTTGDVGVMALAVRSDAGTVFAADGDYVPLSTDSAGKLRIFESGRSVVTTVRNDYSSVNVTTGAWVQLVAALGAAVHELEVFDSSGQTLELGTGGAGAEVRLILVPPGGNYRVLVFIASGTRLSIRAVSATASTGELDINIYGI